MLRRHALNCYVTASWASLPASSSIARSTSRPRWPPPTRQLVPASPLRQMPSFSPPHSRPPLFFPLPCPSRKCLPPPFALPPLCLPLPLIQPLPSRSPFSPSLSLPRTPLVRSLPLCIPPFLAPFPLAPSRSGALLQPLLPSLPPLHLHWPAPPYPLSLVYQVFASEPFPIPLPLLHSTPLH